MTARRILMVLVFWTLAGAGAGLAHDCSAPDDCQVVPPNVDIATGVAAGAAGTAIGIAIFGSRGRRPGKDDPNVLRDVPAVPKKRPGGFLGGLPGGDEPAPPDRDKPKADKPEDKAKADAVGDKPMGDKNTAGDKAKTEPTKDAKAGDEPWRRYPILNEPLGEDRPPDKPKGDAPGGAKPGERK